MITVKQGSLLAVLVLVLFSSDLTHFAFAVAPSAPTNLVATAKSTTSIRLTWNTANVADNITATGGSITTSGGRTIHTFTTSGTYTVTSGNGNIQVLVVGGGGGGGGDSRNDDWGAGGGGAGGYQYNSAYSISAGSTTVTVGAGGTGGNNTSGTNGTNSVFGSITANGGGQGGGGGSGIVNGKNGGSGGGSQKGGTGGTGSQGFNGGVGAGGAPFFGGGGGGDSTNGVNGATTAKGGNGTANSISGASVTYAGGGGGGGTWSTVGGAGGTGGGGSAGSVGSAATKRDAQGNAGTANTGGGGGGSPAKGGNGGSGIVIVSEPTPSAPLTGYKIERESPIGGGWSTIVANTGNTTLHYDDTGLSSNTQYNYRVSGISADGTSPASNTAAAYTMVNPPTGLAVTQNKAKQAHLSWTDGGGNGTATGFFIESSTNNGASWSTVIASTGNSSTTFNQNGVTAGKTFWRVSEIKSSGGGTSAPSGTTNKNIWQTLTVNAKKADGISTFSGSALQSNSTSANNAFTLSPPTAYINGTSNNQNVTIKDFSTLFIVKKQYNTNTTTTAILNLNTNDFLVTCPTTGSQAALEVFSNATDGHQITSFPAPTCYSNNTVKWHPYFIPNGQSGSTYTTTIKVKVLNATYGINPTSFKANSTSILTTFTNPYIVSAPVTVGTGLANVGIYFSMNLAIAPGYQPVNFTVGSLSVNGSNPNINPITFIKSSPSSTVSFVNVTYPSSYNMSCNLAYQYAQTNRTYNNLAQTPAANVGYSYTPFKFTNGSNDLVTFNCVDQNTKTAGKYVLTNSISGIPLITQIKNFQSGKYGTMGQFGAIDLITLLVIIISFIGFNRVNESVGIAFCVMLVGGLAYFQIIQWPTILSAAIAVVIMIALASTKKLPWS